MRGLCGLLINMQLFKNMSYFADYAVISAIAESRFSGGSKFAEVVRVNGSDSLDTQDLNYGRSKKAQNI